MVNSSMQCVDVHLKMFELHGQCNSKQASREAGCQRCWQMQPAPAGQTLLANIVTWGWDNTSAVCCILKKKRGYMVCSSGYAATDTSWKKDAAFSRLAAQVPKCWRWLLTAAVAAF
jgi:hypothetical protein